MEQQILVLTYLLMILLQIYHISRLALLLLSSSQNRTRVVHGAYHSKRGGNHVSEAVEQSTGNADR